MASSVQALLSGFDGRAEFREGLKEMRQHFLATGQFFNAMRVAKILKKKNEKKLFEKLYQQSMEKAAQDLLASARAQEFGDGEFAKWLIEWFSDGGWEIIIEFIKALLPLFAGLAMAGPVVAVCATFTMLAAQTKSFTALL